MKIFLGLLFSSFLVMNVFSQEHAKEYRFLEHEAERSLKNADSLLLYANQILKKAEEEKNSIKKGLAYRYLSQAYFMKNDLFQAFNHAEIAINFLKNDKDLIEEIALCYQIKGKIKLLNDEIDLAYENFMQAQQIIKQVKSFKNPDLPYLLQNDIAYLYTLSGRFDDALKILNETLKSTKSDDVLANTYSIFSIVANYNDNYAESIKYFTLSIPIYERLGKRNAVLICEMNIAINYFYLKEYEKAIVGINKTLEKATGGTDQYPILVRGNLFLSKCYFETKNYVEAKKYFNKTEVLFEEKLLQPDLLLNDIYVGLQIDFLIHENNFNKAKKIAFERLNDKKLDINSKIDFYKQLKLIASKEKDLVNEKIYNDSITAIENKIILENQSNLTELMTAEFKFNIIQNELEIKNKEFQLLQEKEKNNQLVLAFLFGLAIICIAFFLLLFSRQKKISTMREAILAKEKQFLAIQNTQREMEIEFKNKEIVDFALHISEKNEMLSEIKEKLKVLTSNEVNTKKEVNELIFFINNTIDQNSDKVQVYSDVNEIKDSFFQQLKFKFPSLTEKEKRVASLVRMQLSSKQIGQQLNITPASVDNYRSVLRKKMKLTKEDSLFEYLNQLG